MGRSIVLGVVGDSAAGKTTLTRGLVRVLGEESVTHICVDDYHRYDRRQRAERNITPLHPDCNYLDILAQHLRHLRANEAIMKPTYGHTDGKFGPPHRRGQAGPDRIGVGGDHHHLAVGGRVRVGRRHAGEPATGAGPDEAGKLVVGDE